jgi:hypothetical protein
MARRTPTHAGPLPASPLVDPGPSFRRKRAAQSNSPVIPPVRLGTSPVLAAGPSGEEKSRAPMDPSASLRPPHRRQPMGSEKGKGPGVQLPAPMLGRRSSESPRESLPVPPSLGPTCPLLGQSCTGPSCSWFLMDLQKCVMLSIKDDLPMIFGSSRSTLDMLSTILKRLLE